MTFEIAVVDYDLVEIRWPVAFGKLGAAPYQALAQALEPVVGVERVQVLRYSAHVYVAEHVVTLGQLLDELVEALQDPELAYQLRGVGVTDYGVTVVPGVVTRREP